MKTALKIVAVLLVALVLLGAGFYAWAGAATNRSLSRTFETHSIDFPIPYPLEADEVAELGVTEDEAHALAVERALERGRHLIHARYGCMECHAEDFGGGVMVDDPAIGRLLGPNITAGRGGKTAAYQPSDWDRIVRHGVLPDGRPATMPSEDFVRMSDQELSDVIVFIQAQPSVDNEVASVSFGPLGKVLVATGKIRLSADLMESHHLTHVTVPPPTEVSVEFGRHLAATCTGCHGQNLAGGPIAGGPPDWPPARNLTPDAGGLQGWSYGDFVAAMRDARRPDGSELREPMTLVQPFARNMTDVEMEALWTYLTSLEPVAMP